MKQETPTKPVLRSFHGELDFKEGVCVVVAAAHDDKTVGEGYCGAGCRPMNELLHISVYTFPLPSMLEHSKCLQLVADFGLCTQCVVHFLKPQDESIFLVI